MHIADEHLGLLRTSLGCDEATARFIAGRGQQKSFAARDIIIIAGDRSQEAWLLLKGAAQAVAYAPNGQYVMVHGFTPGDFFGEAAGLLAADSELEIAATQPATAGQFARLEFLALMENHACIAIAVARQLTDRLNETTRRMVEVATLSVAGRIHAELLRRARLSHDNAIRPAPVLSELAVRVQTTRETVSRTISALENAGSSCATTVN